MKKYTFRKQINKIGLIASIIFDIEFSKNESPRLSIIYKADSRWENACKAGIEIFFDYFSRHSKGELTVTIIEIQWLPVDTNNLVVLFATINALSEAMNFKISHLEIDAINELFIFPEPRKSITSNL